jgi:hypothetical protein
LKQHLLPRIKNLLADTEINNSSRETNFSFDFNSDDWHAVLFKDDRLYQPDIMWVRYMTYDVRRDQVVIHPGTSHCNVSVLKPTTSPSEHPFWNARVLGIYHVNAIYAGADFIDYNPRRLDFLWVRWCKEVAIGDWISGRLDRVSFSPMANSGSFGFLDPANVLRGCHIIPAFSQGPVHSDGSGISCFAQDSNDWQSYYGNQCVL